MFKKTYKQNIAHSAIWPEHIKHDWEIFKSLLNREGYRIEVEKVKAGVWASCVYYRYVKDEECTK